MIAILVAICYFNSIKVQLKQSLSKCAVSVGIFQFHKGTIKTIMYIFAVFLRPYFNSIKVQLKRYEVYEGDSCFVLFQFHKGTIKTAQRHKAVLDDIISIP